MDADRFDALSRSLSTTGSRRTLAAALGAVIGLSTLLRPEAIEAHDALLVCKKKGKQKKKCLKKARAHDATHATDPSPGGGSDGPDGGADPNQCPGVDLQTDVNNCGECGRTCAFLHAAAHCARGTCVTGQCDPGYADCDPNAAGCETQLGTMSNCSGCGDSCGGKPGTTAVCELLPGTGPRPGTCIYTCSEGFSDCNNDMTDGCEVEGNCP